MHQMDQSEQCSTDVFTNGEPVFLHVACYVDNAESDAPGSKGGVVTGVTGDGRMLRLRIQTAGTEEPVGLLWRSDAPRSKARDAMVALLRNVPAQSRVARRCTHAT